MERIWRTGDEKLKLRTARCLSDSGGSKSDANVGLIGGNIISTGYDRARSIRLDRGRTDTKPAIANAEWNLRRLEREPADRERLLDDLPKPCIVGRLTGVAGPDRGLEDPRIEPDYASRFQDHGSAAGHRTRQRGGASALTGQGQLHRGAAGGHCQTAIAQRGPIDP